MKNASNRSPCLLLLSKSIKGLKYVRIATRFTWRWLIWWPLKLKSMVFECFSYSFSPFCPSIMLILLHCTLYSWKFATRRIGHRGLIYLWKKTKVSDCLGQNVCVSVDYNSALLTSIKPVAPGKWKSRYYFCFSQALFRTCYKEVLRGCKTNNAKCKVQCRVQSRFFNLPFLIYFYSLVDCTVHQ